VSTAGVLLGHYFREEIADDIAISGVFAEVGELSVDIRRPQPRGRRTLYFAQCLSLKAEIFTDVFEIFKNCVPVVGRVVGERIMEYLTGYMIGHTFDS